MIKTQDSLHDGVNLMSKNEFVAKFCHNDGIVGERWPFAEPFLTICEWAENSGATSIVVGGSFVSEKHNPADIDLLVIFKQTRDIQKCPESLFIKEVKLDIQFLAEDQGDLLDALLYLLSTTKAGIRRGVAQIKLDEKQTDLYVPSAKPILYEQVRDLYEGRTQIHIHRNKGLIVPIHGVNTRAEWLQYFSLLASNSGWGLAPFVYGRECVTTLVRQERRDALVEQFRAWLNEIRKVHEGPICILGHSLGSYIFARYLSLMGDQLERFCGVVFAGSIVSSDFDWPVYLDCGKVSAVMNTLSSRDTWVNRMSDGGWRLVGDTLYGRAGVDGFNKKHLLLQQTKIDLLNHTNMFQADIIRNWMNFFDFSLRIYENDRKSIGKGMAY